MKARKRLKQLLLEGIISSDTYDKKIARMDRREMIGAIANKAEEAGHTGVRLGGDTIAEELGKKVVRTLEGDTYHPTGIENIVRTIEESQMKDNYKSGGKVEGNPFGWPSRDARNGGKK